MRLIGTLADRLLDRVSPRAEARAGCDPSCYNWECGPDCWQKCCYTGPDCDVPVCEPCACG